MTDSNIGKRNSKPRKITGKFHQGKGSLKNLLGRTFNAFKMQESGSQERAAGIAEYQAAKGEGSYAQGTKQRVFGNMDQIIGSVTGNHVRQTQGKQRRDQGVAHQNWNRSSKGHN